VIGADFLAFWTGGRMALDGDLAHLYDFEAQGRLQAETIGMGDIGIHPFVSPPFATELYLPFAAAPWAVGLALWTAVSLALVLGSAAWLGKSLLPPGPWALRALAFPPVLAVFLYGQATGWLLLGFTAFVLMLRKGHDLPAGLALGFLAFKPQLLLPWAVWLLVSRRFSALLGLSLGVGIWLVNGELVAPGMLPAFVEATPRVVEMLRSPHYHGWGLANLFGFWLFVADPISPRLTDILTLLSSLALGGFVAVRWARRRWVAESAADDLEIAAALAIGLVLSPHLFFYDLALLVIPLALALRSLGTSLGGGSVLGATGILYVATFAGPTLSRAIENATSAAGVRLSILVLVPAILLWAWTLVTEADRADASKPAPTG